MKVYDVRIGGNVVVVADNAMAAMRVAEDLIRAKIHHLVDELEADDANEIKSADDLPDGWNDGCVPFGADDGKSIGEYFSEEAAE